ncbi:hypothetical protein M9H77_09459 [Catharanthus roseus]|uniref:Uncharacterized protein n=1 Tax=Catharanthus roseus TaxID=4058 RepID=A0ACC0C106_CATRO|nr:hypothetical protein M9H77_09459 [Catharanthus roseus]
MTEADSEGSIFDLPIVHLLCFGCFFDSSIGLFSVKKNSSFSSTNPIEEPGDKAVSAAKYIRKVRQIQEVYNGPLGIGLEGHFKTPNIPYIRATIDALASLGLPIWITELDVFSSLNQVLISQSFFASCYVSICLVW